MNECVCECVCELASRGGARESDPTKQTTKGEELNG